jgi:putative PIN family toxin of toxin-antitoxin system
MRLVLDTNVVVSAILWQGVPGRLLEMAGEKQVRLFTSLALLDELADVLNRKKLAKSRGHWSDSGTDNGKLSKDNHAGGVAFAA